MADLEIFNDGDELYVDSRLIAGSLGIEHKSFMQTLGDYQTQMEQELGVLRFQNAKPQGSKGGRPSRFAYLTEDQATFVMTLSRNSPEVVQAKLDLVKSFSAAKKLLGRFVSVDDLDRVGLRGTLKDDSRLRMTDQVKVYLEQIQKYDDKKYSGKFFARVHDSINILITNETAKQMRDRISGILGRQVKQKELIRDYFPSEVLQRYISMCEASANLMLHEGMHPLDAVEKASKIVLYAGYKASPINFTEHIKYVRERIETRQGQFQLPE